MSSHVSSRDWEILVQAERPEKPTNVPPQGTWDNFSASQRLAFALGAPDGFHTGHVGSKFPPDSTPEKLPWTKNMPKRSKSESPLCPGRGHQAAAGKQHCQQETREALTTLH